MSVMMPNLFKFFVAFGFLLLSATSDNIDCNSCVATEKGYCYACEIGNLQYNSSTVEKWICSDGSTAGKKDCSSYSTSSGAQLSSEVAAAAAAVAVIVGSTVY